MFFKAVLKAKTREQRKRVEEVRKYLEDNWEGLRDWRQTGVAEEVRVPEAHGLGASEAEINHVLAVRMKKRGMSWSEAGAHHMAQMRCLEASNNLYDWLESYTYRRWPGMSREAVDQIKRQVTEPLDKEDPGAWLKAGIPLLKTAAISTPTGQALKIIVYGTSSWVA